MADQGREPDYRFTLANERTFLAWVRTALAFDAAGLAVVHFLPPFGLRWAREAVGVALVLLGSVIALNSYRRWRGNDQAMRAAAPLPRSRFPAFLAVAVSVVSLGAVLLLLVGRGG